MFKVYFAPFARSLRILWTLEELNAPYEPVRVQFPPRVAEPSYLDINPLGQIPTLIHGETKIFESVGACQYINEVCGGGLEIGAGEDGRAAYLQWLWFGEATLMPSLGLMVRHSFGPEEGRSAAVLAEARDGLLAKLAVFDAWLDGRQYAAGERFSLADISVAYALNLGGLLRAADDYPGRVAAYFERMKARPAFQAAAANS